LDLIQVFVLLGMLLMHGKTLTSSVKSVDICQAIPLNRTSHSSWSNFSHVTVHIVVIHIILLLYSGTFKTHM